MVAGNVAPSLKVEILKRGAGGTVLRCTREDGSVTWQRLGGAQAGFFPQHDLTHVAVESVLGARRAFFGLVAAGWDIADTTGTGARGPLDGEALFVERLVGLLDVERGTGSHWDAATFSEQILMAAPALAPHAPVLTEERLARIRARRAELFAQWTQVPEGEGLVVRFPFDP